MSFCDDLRDWDDLSPNERFERVRDWMKGAAAEAGFGDDLSVRREAPPGYPDRRGGYDPDSNTAYLNPDLFQSGRDGGWKYPFDSAAHEFAHHVQDKVDQAYGDPVEVGDGDDGEEEDDANDWSDEDEDVEDLRDDERHDEAQDFADAFLDAAEEACEEDPEGAESALRSFLEDWLLGRGADGGSDPSPAGDWNLPPGETRYG